MIEIFQWIHDASQWIVMVTALGIVGLVGKLIFTAWNDIKSTLKVFSDAVTQFALTVASQRKDLDSLKDKMEFHSVKFKDQDRKFEDQDKRIDALEVGHAVMKTTCRLKHKGGGSDE